MNDAFTRTLLRLLCFPFTAGAQLRALMEGMAKEFGRIYATIQKVKYSIAPNVNMPVESLRDMERKYNIFPAGGSSVETRISRLIKRAGENGNGSPSWLEDQIRGEGFDLYVIVNEPDSESTLPQFGDFQFADVQFGGVKSYLDPRNIDGELVASSPSGYKADRITPSEFEIPSDPNRWPWIFFLSPYPNRIAGPTELLSLSNEEWRYLRTTLLKLKYTRNWCIAQIEVIS